MAITAKYLIRQDGVFVTQWLETLNEILQELDGLIAGKTWEYRRCSLSALETTSEGQKQAILKLGERMEKILLELIKIGGQISPSPMSEIKAILALANDK